MFTGADEDAGQEEEQVSPDREAENLFQRRSRESGGRKYAEEGEGSVDR